MTQTGLKPIETAYKGYRFRSRLEARWAVFLEALNVRYEYESQGYDLGEHGWYLPDFRLPDLKCWLEIKPEQPDFAGPEMRKVYALGRASGEPVYLGIGLPDNGWPGWSVCPRCGCTEIGTGMTKCGCLGDRAYWRSYYTLHVRRAELMAKGARFEHGEGVPEIRLPRASTASLYLAGKMGRTYCTPNCPCKECECLGHSGCRACNGSGLLLDGGPRCSRYEWRDEIFRGVASISPPERVSGQSAEWWYVGPDCMRDHCDMGHEIADECLRQIARADVILCWIHRGDVHGTMAELGFARGLRKPIFVGFDSTVNGLADEVWFARDMADEYAIVPDPATCYGLFEAWWRWKSA